MLVNGKPGDSIGIRDRGLLYGDGIFRTMLAARGKAQGWPLHYHKLSDDCAALGIACPDIGSLTAELDSILRRQPDCVVKLIVTRGAGKRGYAPSGCAGSTRLWDTFPVPEYPAEWLTHGIRAHLCDLRLGHQPRLAGIKHLNRLENVLAAAESDAANAAEGLVMDAADNIIGGTRSNLFLVLHGELVTPDLSKCGVAGIQRDRVIGWAAENHVPLHVREVRLDDVMEAEELFVVSSVLKMWTIREFNRRSWSRFPVSEKIRLSLDGPGT